MSLGPVVAEETANPENLARAHYNLGMSFHRRGEYQQAVDEYRRALQLDNQVPAYHINLGSALESAGDVDAASLAYTEALRLAPEVVFPLQRLGMLAYQRGELDRARQFFQKTVALQPDEGENYYNLGLIDYRGEDYEAAIRNFLQALDKGYEKAQVYYNLGLSYFHADALGPAIESYRQALRLNPEDPLAHLNLGVAYRKRGEFDAALWEYDRVLELNPESVSAHVNQGVVYRMQGKRDEAIAAYQAALALDPENETARFNLNLLTMQPEISAAPRTVTPVSDIPEESPVPEPVRTPTTVTATTVFREVVEPLPPEPEEAYRYDEIARLQEELEAANLRAIESLEKAREAQEQLTALRANRNVVTASQPTANVAELAEENQRLRAALEQVRAQQSHRNGPEMEVLTQEVTELRDRNEVLKDKLDQTLDELQQTYTDYRAAERRQLETSADLTSQIEAARGELERSRFMVGESEERAHRAERELELSNQGYEGRLLEMELQMREAQQATATRIVELQTEVSRLQERVQREHELYVAASQHIKQLEELLRGQGRQRININTAERADLKMITALNERLIDNILWYRQNIGIFVSIDELQNVPGIDRHIYREVIDYVEVVAPGGVD